MSVSDTDERQIQDPGADDGPIGPGFRSAAKAVIAQWIAHRDTMTGAAIAYYSVFSMGPLIVVAITVAALVFDRQGVETEVTAALQGLIGGKGAQAVDAMLKGAGSRGEGLFASIIGMAALLYAAISVVMALKEALNTVWGVTTPPGRGLWRFVRVYVLSLAGVAALGFLLLISMLITAGIAAFIRYVGAAVPAVLIHGVEFAISSTVIALLFALMFRWLPDADVEWKDVWPGAIATTFLFEIGKYAIAFYIGKQGLETRFGTSASIVIVLIWVYYSAQIVILGAEIARVRHRQRRAPARRR